MPDSFCQAAGMSGTSKELTWEIHKTRGENRHPCVSSVLVLIVCCWEEMSQLGNEWSRMLWPACIARVDSDCGQRYRSSSNLAQVPGCLFLSSLVNGHVYVPLKVRKALLKDLVSFFRRGKLGLFFFFFPWKQVRDSNSPAQIFWKMV